MKSLFVKTAVVCASFLLVFGCADLEEINTNPDGITAVTPNMLATELLLDITKSDIGSTKGFTNNFLRDKYLLWTEFPQEQQYNGIGRTSFGKISRLRNARKMMEGAEELADAGKANSYKALGHFMKAYNFFWMTMEVGDIPYSEALQGEVEGIFNPKYDTQKAVFLGILQELEMADQLFANGAQFDGDFIFGGDTYKWRKMVNSFALKVLINLYKKTNDADLNVVQRFNTIVNSKPIFESNADNFSLVYLNGEGQQYPFYKQGNQSVIYPMVSSTVIDRLIANEDYRLFYYAEPSPVKIEQGMAESDFTAYVGTEPSRVYSEVTGIYSSGDFSDINDRYKELPEGEPVYLLSYAQIQFILAEAALRGWTSDNAEAHYIDGIKAAMQFTAEHTPDDPAFTNGRPMTADYINNYYGNTPQIQLSGNTDAQLEQIITQKYLGTYWQAPLQAFFENRRTGFPEFIINPDTNLNIPADKLPVRWLYPSSEIEFNTENVNAAIESQYSGVDNTNGVMWILQ
jgi:hypothetical protein